MKRRYYPTIKPIAKICLCAVMFVSVVFQASPLVVLADGQPLPDSELQALSGYPNWVSGTGNCSSVVPAGSLASFVPEPYNGAFTQGANEHNVAPALIAALFSEEHNLGGSETTPDMSKLASAWSSLATGHPDPNSGWDSSGAGAEGPFQFLPSTFAGLGYDTSQIDNLVISADAAAKYAQTDGATKDKPEDSWKTFIYSYNHANWYVNAVMQYYDYYNTASSGGAGSTPDGGESSASYNGCTGASALSPDCTSASGDAKILCAAKAYVGIYYQYGGGVHGSGGFTGFEAACLVNNLSSAASSSSPSDPGPCATDCSGLVSVAVDSAFGQNLGWNVRSLEADSADWQPVSLQNVQSGDVVVEGAEHVEIVDHYDASAGTLYTFGSHYTGTQTGGITSTLSTWSGAYHYTGPESS